MMYLKRICIIICLCALLTSFAYGKTEKDSTIKLLIEAGAGYGLSTDTLTKAGSRYGVSGVLRFLVKPDYRLRFGLETGWLHIASYERDSIKNEFGTSSVDASLKAIPVMLVFSMNLSKWYMNTGLGYYYVISSISAFGESVTDARWNIGFYLSLSYVFKLNEYLDLYPELKWNSIGEIGKTLLSAQISLSYSLFKW